MLLKNSSIPEDVNADVNLKRAPISFA